jgi:hypothetical protein
LQPIRVGIPEGLKREMSDLGKSDSRAPGALNSWLFARGRETMMYFKINSWPIFAPLYHGEGKTSLAMSG